MIAFAKELMQTNGDRIENRDITQSIADWGLTDEKGNILIPVMHKNNGDDIDRLCKSITDRLSNGVKQYCISSSKLGQIIFYHEVMWDLLDILESKGIISMPAILKGEEVGKEHFGDICFIVLDSAAE